MHVSQRAFSLLPEARRDIEDGGCIQPRHGHEGIRPQNNDRRRTVSPALVCRTKPIPSSGNQIAIDDQAAERA